MPTAMPNSVVQELFIEHLATEIRNRHRSHLRELRLQVVTGGVIMQGVARTFYGKQIALHEVKVRYGLVVVANEIVVLDRA